MFYTCTPSCLRPRSRDPGNVSVYSGSTYNKIVVRTLQQLLRNSDSNTLRSLDRANGTCARTTFGERIYPISSVLIYNGTDVNYIIKISIMGEASPV